MNKSTPVFIVSLVLTGLVLCGCREQAATTPAVVLPGLQRPVITLKAAQTARSQRVLIPAGAYIERSGLPGVFVLSEGQARFRMVRIGKQYAGQLEVLSGLSGNETLVLGNLADIHDGSPIAAK
jgi:multidrug efflux pump subunit AcrA (membrane-fusion protein)